MTEEIKEILQKLDELQAKHDNTSPAWLKIEQAKFYIKTYSAVAEYIQKGYLEAALAVMEIAHMSADGVRTAYIQRTNKFPSGGSHIDSKGESNFEIGETIINRRNRLKNK